MGIRSAPLTPMLVIQFLGILGAIVTQTATHIQMQGRAPEASLLLVDVVWLAFITWWIASVVWLRWRRRIAEDTPDGWFWHSLSIFWSGNVATLVSYLMLMPHAGHTWLLVGSAFCLAPIVLEAIGTVRSPRFGARPWFAQVVPAVLTFVIAPYLILNKGPYAAELGFFLILFTILLLSLRELVQRVVNDLEAARDDALRERDARSRFLASVSHDLLQPMQAARLFFEQALREKDKASRDRASENAHHAFESTELLLNQVVDRMRLDVGAVTPSLKALSLAPVTRRIAEQLRPLAALAGAELRVVTSSASVIADEQMVERILGNLIGNSIRYAKARRITVGVRRRGPRLRIWVIDNGIGVDASEIDRIFTEFQQGNPGGNSPIGGFGLGLSSSRKMARLMFGDVGVQPHALQGAAFWLELERA